MPKTSFWQQFGYATRLWYKGEYASALEVYKNAQRIASKEGNWELAQRCSKWIIECKELVKNHDEK